MFDSHGSERLAVWKSIRDKIETCDNPLQLVSDLWSNAPFVSTYMDPFDPKRWPDPWHLILDGKFDNLAICLGMLYTLQLTQRFMHAKYEIHMSINPKIKDPAFFLSIDRTFVLNYVYKEVVDFNERLLDGTTLLYTKK